MNITTTAGSVPVPRRNAAVLALPPAAGLSTTRKVLAFGVMCLGCFMAYLDIPVVIVSIQEIGGGLAASQVELSWFMTSYLIAEIIVIPLSAWLGRVMSTRWLVTASAAGFTLASLLCSTAWDVHSMIVFRALQGFFGGAMIPAAQTAAVTFFPDRKSAIIATSMVGLTAGLGPTLGPVLSGWITDSWSWRWLFYINIVPGAVIVTSIPVLLTTMIEKPDLTLLRGADYLGMVLMALCLGCLNYVLEDGYRWDWLNDGTIRTCALVSALAGIGFVFRSLTSARPVVDLRALANRNFSLGCWFSFVIGVGIFGFTCLTVLFLGRVRGFIAWNADTILSAGLFQVCAIPVYVVLANYFDLRWLLMFGLTCFGVAMWLFTPIMNQWGWQEMLLPMAFRGVAVAFSIAATTTLALGGIPRDRLAAASGLFALTRSLGGSIGIAGCGILLNSRVNLHFLHIAEHLTATNTALVTLLQGMTARYGQALGDTVGGQTAALKNLWLLAYREAQVQAFADAYLVIAACFALSVMMVPLMRKTAASRVPTDIPARCPVVRYQDVGPSVSQY
jgi:MFS transporter, DHA2 family, multidrug resistance protein